MRFNIKIIALITTFLLGIHGIHSQQESRISQRNPKVMVIPSDQWMFYNNFTKDDALDYDRAYRESKQLSFLTVQLNSSLTAQGIEITRLDEKIKLVNNAEITNKVVKDKDGSRLTSSMLQTVIDQTRPDLLVLVNWPNKLKTTATGKSYMEITVEVVDANTGIAFSSVVLRSPEGFLDVNQSIEAAIEGGVMDVEVKLRAAFNKMIKRGRPVELEFQTNGDLNFYTEFGDDYDELGEIVRDWIVDNAVSGQANHQSMIETRYLCSPRIGLEYQGSREFLRAFRKFMRKKYGVKSTNVDKGNFNILVILSKP